MQSKTITRFRRGLVPGFFLCFGAFPVLSQETEAGAELTRACAGCHGVDMRGGTAIPAITGHDSAAMVAILSAFQDADAQGTIMPRIMAGYSSDEIALLAEYLAEVAQ